VFYNKKTGESKVFLKTTEGINIVPRCFTDDYIICELECKDKDMLKNVLSEVELKKLNAFSEEDNPYIVKYIFKK